MRTDGGVLGRKIGSLQQPFATDHHHHHHKRATHRDLKGVSLFMFSPTHPLRVLLARIVLHPFFDLVVMFIIIGSSLALALDYPRLAPSSALKQALKVSRAA